MASLSRDSEAQEAWIRTIEDWEARRGRATKEHVEQLLRRTNSPPTPVSMAPLELLVVAESLDTGAFLATWDRTDESSPAFRMLKLALNSVAQRSGADAMMSAAAARSGVKGTALLEAAGGLNLSAVLLQRLIRDAPGPTVESIFLGGPSRLGHLTKAEITGLLELAKLRLRHRKGEALSSFRLLHRLAHLKPMVYEQLQVRGWIQEEVLRLHSTARAEIETYVRKSARLRASYPLLVR